MDYKKIGRLIPHELVREAEKLILSAGYKISAEKLLGVLIFYSIGFAILTAILTVKYNFYPIALIPLVLLSFWILPYLVFIFARDSRKEHVEKVLPDFFQLTSANIRAGMTVDTAIWASTRPQFGILNDEIEMISKQVFGGEDLKDVLANFAEKYDSRALKRSIKLVIQGIKSGGKIADLLERVSLDMRNSSVMKREIKSNVMMYVIFILFATVIGSPILFALSTQLLGTMNSIFNNQNMDIQEMPASGGMSLPLSFSGIHITSSEFQLFAISVMMVSSFFSSLIVSSIQSGVTKKGLKLFPFVALISLLLFFFFSMMLSSFFSGIIG